MRIRITRLAGALSLAVAMTLGAAAEAARISLIRDAEIESTIRAYATPLFVAAGLDIGAVRVHLVNDERLNAFVAGGMQVFINTGLLRAAESPSQIIGVIAHETGHIAGGHLARAEQALRSVQVPAIVTYILGLGAAIAGAPGIGQAIMLGGQAIAQQSLLQYSRTQEQSADQFAVTMLDRTGQSARGLLEFLELMNRGRTTNRRLAYLSTHPLASDRISFVRQHLTKSVHSNTQTPPEFVQAFRRMQAKLYGFLEPPERTFARYPETDQSLEARYARAAAYHRRSKLVLALGEVDSLIAELPADPYFHELKGQILFESGSVAEAVGPYRRAVELLPDSPLLRIGLAHALVESGDGAVLADAAEHLEVAVREERDSVHAWWLLSVAYGRGDRPGRSALASAERALITGRYREAVAFSKRAEGRLPFGAPGHLRAGDIQRAAEARLKKK